MEYENKKLNKRKAIEKLKEFVYRVQYLSTLKHNNQEFRAWLDRVAEFLKSAFDYNDYQKFVKTNIHSYTLAVGEEYEKIYQNNLLRYKTSLESIIDKYEVFGIEEKTPTSIAPEEIFQLVPPKAFIAHGGETPALEKLKRFLMALGVEPVIVEEQPSRGRSIGENVDYYAKHSDFAVILATKGDKDVKSGGFIPRGNVLIEIGKAQELFPDRTIYLRQAGVKFPSNISEKVGIRFVPQSMDDSFIQIAKEICEYGIIKAVKPQSHSSRKSV